MSRAGQAQALAIQKSAEAAKRQRKNLLIAAAFLAAIVFVLGLILGHRFAH